MINVFGANTGEDEAARAAVAIKKGWMGMGTNVRAFEDKFSSHLGVSDFVMLDSGSNALYMAVRLLNLPVGSEVIVPSFTWVACGHAPLLAGCQVKFCDVDLDTQNVRAEDLERALTPNTRAVMVVHYAGLPVRMNDIRSLGLPVIEDAAHAVDSSIGPSACGTIGDVGIFSFDAVKNLATPEGGGLFAAREDAMAAAKQMRYCGIGKSGYDSKNKDRWWEYDVAYVWPKTVPNDVSAAIGLAQLERLPDLQKRRREIWDFFQTELANIPWLIRPTNPDSGTRHSYFTYFIRIVNGWRDALARYMMDNGVYTTLRYHPLHMNPVFASQERLPNCELLNDQGLNLPLHPAMSENDAGKVVDLLRVIRSE